MTRVLLILSICLAIHGHQTDALFAEVFSIAVTSLKAIFGFASEVKTIAEDSLAIRIGRSNMNRLHDVERNLVSISGTIHHVEEDLESMNHTISKIATGIAQLNAAMKNVSRQLYNIEENLINGLYQLRVTLLHRLPLEIQHDARLQQLTKSINEINDVYENFVYYSNASHSYEPTTISRFMTDLVGDSSKLNNALDSVFDQLLSNEQISPNLLSVFMAVESNGQQRCGNISPQQKLFKIYQTIMLTEMQGYAMNVYAFGLLKQVHNASYTGELDKLENQFKRRCGRYMRSMKSALSILSTEIHLCDHSIGVPGRGINFHPQIADVEKNMVVVGVRLLQENGLVTIQIEQGKLMPLGEIKTVDQPWKPIKYYPSDPRRPPGHPTDREIADFMLDDITVPDNFVLTGLQYPFFSSPQFNNGQMRVHVTKYNSDTGNLEVSNSMWISDAKTAPTGSNMTGCTMRGMDWRPVSMEPRFALSAVGLYFQCNAERSVSYGLRLFGLNIARHIDLS